MTRKISIALYNKKLFLQLEKLDFSGIKFLLLTNTSEECAADILLLEDEEVRSASKHCNSASRPSFFVLANDECAPPSTYVEGIADDLLVLPVRRLDILRLVRLHHQMQDLRELENSSKAIPFLVQKMKEDLQLAQKVQRTLIRDKFPPIAGLKIKSKYWCGMQSGGDYFDVFEFPKSSHVGILLTDSSSYSLSTSFLGSLLQLPMHLAANDPDDPVKVVEAIYGKLRESMKDKDEFSILYAVLDKKTYQMRLIYCGKIFALSQSAGSYKWIAEGNTKPLTKEKFSMPKVKEIILEPSDRLVLLSDGWKSQFKEPMENAVQDLCGANTDAQDLMNELAFSLHKNNASDEEESGSAMPEQDCSVLVIEIAKNILRLTKKTNSA